MNDVLALILGGGRGRRLFPLTHMRSKPAVPIGGKYRLIDMPISNCLHAGLKRIFVLTQFNSASLNRHIAQTYRLDMFSGGFVEVLAAEQTPDGRTGFKARRTRCARPRGISCDFDAEYYLILAGDHLYRMDFGELIDAHIESRADITIAAQPVTADDATEMGIFRFDDARPDRRLRGEAERRAAGRDAAAARRAAAVAGGSRTDKPFVASMGIYVFSRDVLLDILAATAPSTSAREIIPDALGTHRVHTYLYPRLLGRRRHGPVVLRREPSCSRAAAHRSTSSIRAGRSTRIRDSCRPRALTIAASTRRSWRKAAYLDSCVVHRFSRRHPHAHERRRAITRSVLLGADFYEEDDPAQRRGQLGIGRDVVLERAIVDKNARIGGRRRASQHARHPARRRRRLVHSRRHHHRAEGRGGAAGARHNDHRSRRPSRNCPVVTKPHISKPLRGSSV